MYSSSKIAVDKGVGFDFSEIANLVKTALPVGLNIFQQQTQLKQIKAMQQPGYIQSPGVYGQTYGQLPMSQVLQPQPTFGQPLYQQKTGWDTGTVTVLGLGLAASLLFAYKLLK